MGRAGFQAGAQKIWFQPLPAPWEAGITGSLSPGDKSQPLLRPLTWLSGDLSSSLRFLILSLIKDPLRLRAFSSFILITSAIIFRLHMQHLELGALTAMVTEAFNSFFPDSPEKFHTHSLFLYPIHIDQVRKKDNINMKAAGDTG